MATGSLYGSTSESTGLYGIGAASGGTYFEWFVFQDSATAPPTPTGGSWNFSNNTGTPPTGWVVSPPPAPVNQVWVSIVVVDSRNVTTLSWSVPGLMTGSGLPILSASGVPASGTGLNGQLYINTATTPQSLYFKQSGAWTQLSGSNLVDLVNNQTIGGVKTFTQTIQGDISGSAGNVSGVVAVANGGTGASTAANARTNLGLGSIATQDASAVAITGGSITGITDLAVADGGTGASSASVARTNLGAVGLSDTQTLTNKTISGASNTLTNIPNSALDNDSVNVNGVDLTLGAVQTLGPNWILPSYAGNAGKVLAVNPSSSDVQWVAGGGVGSVTSVDVSGGTTGLTTSGGPITAAGVITLAGTLAVANGGTGVTTSTGTGSTVLSTSPALTTPSINLINDTNGNEILSLSPVTSATDYFTVKNGIGVGVPLHLQADGPSANIGLHIQPKGTGLVTISDGTDFNKGIRFRSSGSAAGVTTLIDAVSSAGHVITLPNANTTLVGRDTTDTLTNKTFGDNPTFSAGTANAVAFLNGSKVLTTGSALTFDGAQLGVNGITVGRGAGAVATNTAVGASALAANTTGSSNTAVGSGALIANTTGTGNTSVGWNANVKNTTGSYNTGIGAISLGYNSAAVTGSNNIAIGYAAMYNATSANQNVSVGDYTLQLITSGANNTALGFQALVANTTANNNTAVGYQAGYSNQTGVQSVSVGALAGYSGTTADGNVAVGYEAGYTYAAGNANTSVGYRAGKLGVGYNNTAIGYNALTASTGGANTAVGSVALINASTGNYLTAVGNAALNANTTGSNNTAFGYASLYSNTTASNSVAVGYQALFSHATGGSQGGGSIAIGAAALFSHTGSAGSCVAIGQGAGYSITTGAGNTAIGQGVLYASTTGQSNTAVGGYDGLSNSAMRLNTTGSYNSAFGVGALASNTTASNNTAVGYQAGYSNTTGTLNTFIGNQAGYSVTTGSQNCFVGQSQSGYYVTTGSDNTILGNFSGNQGGLDIRTADNYIVLSDGDGNPRLHFNGTTWFTFTLGSGAGTNALKFSTATGAWTYDTSSARYKDNIRDSIYGLSHVMQMRSTQFEYKDTGRSDVGLIAEELDPIIPELVGKNKDGQPDSVSYDRMVSVLVKAIQELKSELDSVKAELATLKGN